MKQSNERAENKPCTIHGVVSSADRLTEGQIAHQTEMDDEEDSLWEDEDNFQCCDNCDLPDACCDYGCAIQQGLREDPTW